MAFLQIECFSETLSMAVSVSVVLPQPAQREIGMNAAASGEEHPVLWLLHGASDDHTTWLRRTSIERYASERGLAVVMPNAHLSSYANMAHGGRFYDFVSDELPRLMREFLPLSAEREDNFIAGNSMGGYGAMKIGVNHPDRYAAIGCFSAGVNRPGAPRSSVIPEDEWKRRQKLLYDGQDITGTLEDTLAMVKKNSTLPVLPRVYHTCGTQDFLLDRARETRDLFLSLPGNPYGYVYEEHEGVHDWDYWDRYICDFLQFTAKP